MPLERLHHAVGQCSLHGLDASSDNKELKRKYWDLIRKSDEGDEVPNLTGHEVARWRNSHHFGKTQGKIEELKVLKVNMIDSFFY